MEKVDCIGAASIVAKVVRDKFMSMLDRVFPDFNFSKHKGYGTKEHLNLLKKIALQKFLKNICSLKNLINSTNCIDSNMDNQTQT